MSQSSSNRNNATVSDGLDLKVAEASRRYYPSQPYREPGPLSPDGTPNGVHSPPLQSQSENFSNDHQVDKQWVHYHDTGFTAFSLVSTIRPTNSSPLVNLHHRTGTNFQSQELDYIEFSVQESFPSSVPPDEKMLKLKRTPEYFLDQGELGGVTEEIRRLFPFFRASSPKSQASDDFCPTSLPRSFSNSSVSSLGSSHSFDDSPVSRLGDIFKPIDLAGSDLKATSSTYLDLGSNKSRAEAYILSTTQWNRYLLAQRMHQDRRRIRQLVSFAASVIINTLFLSGIILVSLERQWSGNSVSNELAEWQGPIIDAPDRDALIIYRIIGNDLPPRHSPTQTLTNLKFMLEHERDLEEIPAPEFIAVSDRVMPSPKLRVKKFFVLNRIVNQTQLSLVENMLKDHGVKEERILVNEFLADTYRDQPLNPPPDLGGKSVLYPTWGIDKNSEGTISQGQAEFLTSSNNSPSSDRWKVLEFTYHFKNLYAMNNNGGRNFALDHGRAIPEARWILPLDGNCFFTPAALNSLVLSLRESDLQPHPPSHVVIPMSRLTDNEQAMVQNIPIDLNEFDHDGDRVRKSLGPKATDEPQVGFRFTSKEIYSPKMRYGRRSKLEFLWRLGAIDRDRNLDQKTNDWEVLEKGIITGQSYGSIKRTLRRSSPDPSQVHSNTDHLKDMPDFILAGWVLRLFSGDQAQEHHSEKARSSRCVNRMKGIISFLEGVDESITRGSSGCRTNHSSQHCGFSDRHLWSLDGEELEKLKVQHINKDTQTLHLVDRLVKLSETHMSDATSIFSKYQESSGKRVDLSEISGTVFLLALTGYLTHNEKYTDTAASLVNKMLLQPSYFSSTPDAFQVTLNTHLRELRHQADYDGFGYAFPIPRHKESLPNWMNYANMDHLPFNPYTFDPTLLLDGIRLLWNDWQSSEDKPQSEWLKKSLKEKIPRQKIKDLFTLQTSHLLLNNSIVQTFYTQGSDEMAGLNYATKLSALASFTDDVQLLNRILTRTPIGSSLLPKIKMSVSHSLRHSNSIHLHQRFRDNKNLDANSSLENGFVNNFRTTETTLMN